MYTVRLMCGTTLAYEASGFVPAVGERVPCRHHGYCSVEIDAGGGGGLTGGSPLPRARPRSRAELLDFLRTEPVTTVHALRRRRFTLRMIAAAERDGFVDVDLCAGRVTLRFSARARSREAS
jgi:hypothetical protein